MKLLYISVSILALMNLTVATPCTLFITSPGTTTTAIETSTRTSSSAQTMADMTIAVTNLYGAPLSLSLGVNTGFPTPLNDPQATVLFNSASTQYIYPTGWAGRIYVGQTSHIGNSLIEGSYTNGSFINVSYVDGFSVPITCSCDGVPVTGCNIDLFNQPGIICEEELEGHICNNPVRHIRAGGPPAPFFAACAGAAYTFPADDDAVRKCLGPVSCCIGTSCKPPLRQLQTRGKLLRYGSVRDGT